MADCKRKTANLFDVNRLPSNTWTIDDKYYIDGAVGDIKSSIRPDTVDANISNSGDLTVTARSYYGVGFVVAVTPNTTYTISFTTDKAVPSSKSIATITYVNADEDFLNYITIYGGTSSVTFTTPGTAYYILITFRYLGNTITYSDIMLNTGSTPLPYEPYGWIHSLRKLTTATDTITTLPVDVYADGNNATVGLKGNTVQNGTPTPDNPIMPQGTGERTGNLFDKTADYTVGVTTYDYTISGLDPNKYYTCSTNFERISGVDTASIYFNGGNSVNNGVWRNTPRTFKPDSNGEIIIYIRYLTNAGAPSIIDDVMAGTIWVMLNLGSTTLPYEPYGYKIPISSAGQTTPIYLGEVESTRYIVKTVLTSNTKVDWAKSQTRNYSWYFSPSALRAKTYTPFICSHGATVTSVSDYVYGTVFCDNTINLGIFPTNLTTVNNLKSWLDEQYAAGTPVVIWTVYTSPTTGIVNEPLMKIRDYADTVSGITVPTITGKDAFDVKTTLKPSEVSLSYTGWHDASVKEAKHGNNLFDYTTMSVSDENSYLYSDGTIGTSNDWNITAYIPCDGTSFTVGDIGGNTPAICLYNANKEYITGKSYNTGGTYSKQAVNITSQTIAKFIRFSYCKGSLNPDDISAIMLNSGSTLLPYEPYSIHWE